MDILATLDENFVSRVRVGEWMNEMEKAREKKVWKVNKMEKNYNSAEI